MTNYTCPYLKDCDRLKCMIDCYTCRFAKVDFVVHTGENKEDDKNEESDMS